MPGRPISTKYQRRIARIPGTIRMLQMEAKKDLLQGLQNATDEQLYNITKLRISGRMYDSIGTRLVGDGVEVGYNIGAGPKAPYARIRLQMKGRYKTGPSNPGRKDMNPNSYLRKHVDPNIRRRNRMAQQRILGS